MRYSRGQCLRRRMNTLTRRRARTVLRAFVLVASFGVALACVDLTPPPAVVNYRNGLGKGGAPGSGGSVGTGGSAGVAGTPGSGGTAGVNTVGGMTSTASGGAGGDTTSASGGAAGRDAASTGGSDGTAQDGPPEDVLDAPQGSGGVVGSGGVAATGGAASVGGAVGSGGAATTGGTSGSGGAVVSGGVSGTGGTTGTGGSATYNCANAIVPANGVVTDFRDWNATTARWGTGALTGSIYQYAGGSATMSTAKVEGTTAGLHLVGSVPQGSYSGGGLLFLACVTATSFTTISFDTYGSAANCSIELQLQTFDQRPVEQSPPGGCKSDAGTTCYKVPAKSQVVSLSPAVAAPGKTVTTTLATMTNWSASEGAQLVGIQWQFTSSGGTCTPDATFTNIKFAP